MKRYLFAIALGMVGLVATTGCSTTPATSTNVNVSTTTNDSTNNSAGQQTNDATNNTSSTPSGGGDTNTPSDNQPSNDTGQGSGNNAAAAIKSSDAGLAIVKTLYAATIAKDHNLHIDFDHTEQDNGHTVYAYHVYDQMTSSQATVAWVGVRDDGKVKDMLTGTDWLSPSEFNVQK